MRILITGTTSGIGRAVAKQFLTNGDSVIAVNRRDLSDSETLPGASHLRLNISDPATVKELLSSLESSDSLPDIFILNAGINVPDNVGRFDFATFQRVMDVDLMGALTFVGAAADLSLRNRTFVALSSTSNIVPNPGHIGYYLAKKGLYDAFGLLRKTNPDNEYKVAVLGPVHSNIMRDSPPLDGLKKKIFDFLAVSSEEAAAAMVAFAKSRRRALNYPLAAVAFYHFVRFVLFFMPTLYSGTRSGGEK